VKHFILLIATAMLSACSAESSKNESNVNPVYTAVQYLGLDERMHRTRLHQILDVDPVQIQWCAAFVNAVLKESNIPNNELHNYPLTARSFFDWGFPISKEDIRAGDIVIFPRGKQGWQGHVGFFLKKEIVNGVEYYHILGGNQSNRVDIDLYRSSYAIGIRRHSV